MQHLQQHLSRWLILYALGVMGLGVGLGWPSRVWTAGNTGSISTLTTVAVFLIIYPMMVNVRFNALGRAGRKLKPLLLALGYNFLWAPLIGYVLAHLFLNDPALALGFLLVMVVPCSSMSIAYTGLAEGDLELATVVVAASFVLSIAAVPLWMALFAASYHLQVPMSDLLISILEVLIGPMIAAYLTRAGLVHRFGETMVKRLQPALASASMIAMFLIIFLIFFGKADMIVAKWQTVLLLFVPNLLFIAITLVVATLVDRWIGLPYREHMAVVFASTGKNNGTAIAIATMALSPIVAIPAATLPIFQILLLIGYLRLAGPVRRLFPGARVAGAGVLVATPSPGAPATPPRAPVTAASSAADRGHGA
jgi:ACR3 family arsenite transporter